MNSTMDVVIPDMRSSDGFRNKGLKEIPVLYLLHPEGGNYTNFIRFTLLEEYAENANMAVIMSSTDQGAFTDMEYGYDYFTFLTDELPEIVKHNFPRISHDIKYVAGISLGSTAALKWGLNYPNAVKAVGLISAVTDIPEYIKSKEEENNAEIWVKIENIWGKDKDIKRNADDLIYLAHNAAEAGEHPDIYMYLSENDSTYQMNREFAEEVPEMNIKQILSDSRTGWKYWNRCIEDFIGKLKEMRW